MANPSSYLQAWRLLWTALLLAIAVVGAVPAKAQTAPVLLGASSRKAHGAAGTFDLPLALTPANPTTEPRQGPLQTVVFTFDKSIIAGTAVLTEGTAVVGVVVFSGSEMIVPLIGVADLQYVTVAVTSVVAADGGAGGSGAVRIGYLAGDVSQNRTVTLSDLAQVNAQVAQLVSAANFTKDVNASGTLSLADKGITNLQVTKVMAAVPLPANEPPHIDAGANQTVTLPASANLSGSGNDDGLPGPSLSFTWTRVSGPGTVNFGTPNAAATSATFSAAGVYVLRLITSDGVLSNADDVTVTVNASGELPPDPATIAPPLDATVATNLATATSFLYTGPNPIQTGVVPNTIEPRRVAVIRGKVLQANGEPLSGVTITVLDHLEFGQTLSRQDGAFDFAVNGGGALNLRYERAGFMPIQRQAVTPWQDYVIVADVVMMNYDSKVTPINLAAAIPMQVASGNLVTDADGTRKATVFFPAGTAATMQLPNGTTQPLTTLTVRATEYTVGPNGPQQMPAPLPPSSGYTYAVELSVDEALAAGATRVSFNQPVISYTENFLHFPVGSIAPSGYFDRAKGVWIPSQNGRVIKVLSVANGLANVDTTGNGFPDNGVALAMSDSERQQLALLYTAGQSLWRVSVSHFSAWDFNWPFGPPANARGPNQPLPKRNKQPDDDCNSEGSIIGCQSQILGEALQITGAPFRLHYTSERTRGRKPALDIPLSGGTLPPGVRRIDLQVSVSGQQLVDSIEPAPNQRRTIAWDGTDAYGRTVQGEVFATVRIGYVYDGVYLLPSQAPGTNYDALFGHYSYFGTPATADRARREVTLWQESQTLIGGIVLPAKGLGGWSVGPHHVYDPTARALYLGDGTRRGANVFGPMMTTAAGSGVDGLLGDGGPATASAMKFPFGIAVGPDGTVYFADSFSRIRRVGTDGIIRTVAGTTTGGFSGDGGLATNAQLNYPTGVTVAGDGSIYIADTQNGRIRRVGRDGIITTVAGKGVSSFSGDGGPATQAGILPVGVAVGADGSFFIVDGEPSTGDNGPTRIRRVGTDGIITTVAGNGTKGFSGDGGPATQASLAPCLCSFPAPARLAVAPDGTFYIADWSNHRIRRVGTDGIITTVVGNGTAAFSGDGGPAAQANVWAPNGVSVGPDGSLYIGDNGNWRIRRVGTDGIITSVAGNGTAGFGGDGGPATQAKLGNGWAIAAAPDGSVYFSDVNNRRIRRVISTMPGVSLGDTVLPSQDGEEIYVFSASASGRHTVTYDALTGAIRYQFTYDNAGQLIAIGDGDGNVSAIERDGSGNPIAIVAPGGQRTTFALDVNGYLAAVTNPANDRVQLTYTGDGLLVSKTDARGGLYRYSYDANGLLLKDEDPAGGSKTLARAENSDGYTVTVTTALARTTSYQVQNLSTGSRRRVTTDASGFRTVEQTETDGSRTITLPDGTVSTQIVGPDPRFAMESPITASLTLTIPSGLKSTTVASRTATLTDPNNPLSVKTLTDTTSINGRTYTSAYDAAAHTFTDKSPAGRQTVTTIDQKGRPTQAQIGGLQPVTLTYDAKGRLNTITDGTGSAARLVTFAYDAQNNLESVTDPLGRTTSFAYDPAGRMSRKTFSDGRTIDSAYDANGNVISVMPPGRPNHSLTYTPVDLEASYVPPDVGAGANQTLNGYDVDRRLTSVTLPDGQIQLSYDSAGRLSTVGLATGQIGYSYSATTGNLAGVTAPSGDSLVYAYDGSLLTSVTYTGPIAGSVSYTYDKDFRITSQSIDGGNLVNFSYDTDGLLTQAGSLTFSHHAQSGLLSGTTLGSVSDSWTYNGLAEPLSYGAASGATSLYDAQFTRDKLGRITQKIETIGGTTDTYDYQYDGADRLAGVKKNGLATSSYTYDSSGNRTGANSVSPITATYDDQDRLTRYGSTTYTSTAGGKLLAKTTGTQTTTYLYDELGNLPRVNLPTGTVIDYVIDGNGRRIGKKVNGILVQGFLYEGALKPVAELNGANSVVSRFIYAIHPNVPDYMIKGGQTYRIVTDHLGSPRLVVNTATGSIAQRLDYDEFGNVTLDTNPGFQPFGFGGGIYDRDTRLVRFGRRDYDAETGRWTAKDPALFAGGQANLYVYVMNDPLNATDPTGLDEGGTIICRKGEVTPVLNESFPWSRYGDLEKELRDCAMKHEESHAGDAPKGYCKYKGKFPIHEEDYASVGGDKQTALSEIKAYETEKKCLQEVLSKRKDQKGKQAKKELKVLNELITNCDAMAGAAAGRLAAIGAAEKAAKQ